MKILFAVRVGDEDWQEQVITENPAAIDKASEWALANGFDRLRVWEFDENTKPEFGANLLNRKGGAQ